MLSKSSAKIFFLGGTTAFSVIFLGLTVDTIRQTPARTNQPAMNASVISGHEIWTDNNCMGCHTLLGEGAYYAPELTKVYSRRGEAWMRMFLKDPNAMYPNDRKMVNYHLNDQQITDLIAFFQWIEGIDTNNWPPKPDLTLAQAQPAEPVVAQATPTGEPGTATASAPPIFKSICISCHALDGQGGAVGPALDHLGTRKTEAELDAWLADPAKVKPGTTMPKLPLSEADRAALAHFLASKR